MHADMTVAASSPMNGVGLNILMLTSEFAPATGGIGTYAARNRVCRHPLGARVTVVAPDYAKQTADDDEGPALQGRALSRRPSLDARPAGQDPAGAAAGVRGGDYDVVHAADWPFFIPVALSRWRTHARVLMTVHGTEINETQTPLKRASDPRLPACSDRGPRSPPTAGLPKRCSASASPSNRAAHQRDPFGRIGFLVRRAKQAPRDSPGLSLARRQAGDDHRRTDDPPQGPSSDACRVGAASGRSAQSYHVARGRAGRRSRLCQRSSARRRASRVRHSSPRPASNEEIRDIYGSFGFLLPDRRCPTRPAGSRGLDWSISRPQPPACPALPPPSAVCLTPYSPTKPEFSFRHR